MMSRPGELAAFLRQLADLPKADERLELVVAGDIVDFLAVPKPSRWTPDPEVARTKLEHVLAGVFQPVFDALAEFVADGHRLTLLLGNHDLELALPPVEARFLESLGASLHDVLLLADGRAYRVGEVLIEHGNRYDGANVNDWDGLRAIASALSRGEEPPCELEVSAGSTIVEKVVAPLKPAYPFLDLLQPQGELLAYLLLAFEPKLRTDWGKIAQVLRGGWKQTRRRDGAQPGRTRQVAATGEAVDRELESRYGEAYRELRGLRRPVRAFTDWQPFHRGRKESLAEILRCGGEISEDRLLRIWTALRRMLLHDESFRLDGPTGPYGAAAQRLFDKNTKVVVMGHTHLAREVRFSEGLYLNTGTWADIVRVPAAALAVVDESAKVPEPAVDALDHLDRFLRTLINDDGSRRFVLTWADLRVEADGRVTEACLQEWSP